MRGFVIKYDVFGSDHEFFAGTDFIEAAAHYHDISTYEHVINVRMVYRDNNEETIVRSPSAREVAIHRSMENK